MKVFCPKCEEVYIPKFKSINVDGAYFGTSVPHVFIKTFKNAIVLPPKIHKFQPTIHGFKVFGKKGSKYAPETGRVRKNPESEDKENLRNNPAGKKKGGNKKRRA